MKSKQSFFLIPLLLLLALTTSTLVEAQSTMTIKGKLINNITKKPIPFASVVALDNVSDKVKGGGKTDANGLFNFQTSSNNIYLKITSIGYKDLLIKTLDSKNGQVQLGNVLLERKSSQLKAVVVQTEKSTTEFKLDKRVFNVGQDLSSSGASALEVLNNVPSVNVNIEGEVALRGSNGVQILINGKPSVIASESGNALGTITADMIEKIEVITNPSAKYEAEGSAGIINIVLKKNERKGVNGSASLNLGWPQNHSFGLSLNRRSEKLNLFSQLGAGYRELPRYGYNINTNRITNTTIQSEGKEFRNEQFYNFILGTDYYLNERNVLTLSGSVALEVEEQPSNYNFISTNESGATTSEWNRSEVTEAINPKYQYELQYKRDFKDHKEHTLLFSAIGNFFGKDQSSEFENVTVSGTNNSGNQRTRTNFKEAKYTFNLDYTKPFKKYFKLEAGAQYQSQDVSNDFEVSNLVNENWEVNPGLTNIFDYQQSVLGVYSTGSYERDAWGVKLGLRAENTDLNTFLVNTQETNDRNFTNLFPTVHTSYKINKAFSVQAGYSRRIYRPRLWDLNPFFNIRNNFSIRVGNPNLLPEFTNSYELAGIYIFDKASVNLTAFQRNTSEVIERLSFFEDNVNTVRPENIGKNYATGLELLTEYEPHKKIKILNEIGYNYFNRVGSLGSNVFDFSADRWSTELTLKFKLPKELDIEVEGEYQSGYVTIQGNERPQAFANFGLRKKLFKKKGVINFSVRDIFVTRIRRTVTEQDDFYVFSRSYRGRFITLGFSYGFGKGEAMEFSGRRRR